MRQRFFFAILLLILVQTRHLIADQFHYNNVIMGDRAIGLGGAYTAVADDASGVFYNPAGLAFALSNDVSGSANAFYSHTIVYKNTIGGKNFKEKSTGSLPSFFGGLQKLDHIVKGLVFAFGIYSTDSEQKDQDDLILSADLEPSQSVKCGNTSYPTNYLDRLHRTVNQNAATYYTSFALSWRPFNSLSVGVGAGYVSIKELIQEYQGIRQTFSSCDNDKVVQQTLTLAQNIRQNLTGYGIQPMLGLQTSIFGRLSLGLVVKLGMLLSQKYEQQVEIDKLVLSSSDQKIVDDAAIINKVVDDANITPPGTPVALKNIAAVSQQRIDIKSNKPLGTIPTSIRAGAALFATTRLLATFDIQHHLAVKNAETIGGNKLYERNAVTNYAAGVEYYVVPSVPVRIGAFTNNDSRPKLDHNKSNQRDHIDYIGTSLFVSFVQPNSQLGGGFVVQQGKGEAQKLGGSTIQKVASNAFTFVFSATHSF